MKNLFRAVALATFALIGSILLSAGISYAAPFPYAVGGTGTTTAPVGQLLYGGATAYQSVATTTASCSGSTTCSSFTIIGSSPVTISSSASGSGLGTTSPWTSGYLAYVVNDSTVSSVATTTLTATSPLSLSNPISVIGASASALTISTTTNSLFSGTPGQVLAYVGAGWKGVATTTFSSPLLYSAGNVTCQVASGSLSGCLSSTDWTTFNNKGSGTLTAVTGTWPVISSGGNTPAISLGFSTSTALASTQVLVGTAINTFGSYSSLTFNSTSATLTTTNASSTNMSASSYLAVNSNAVRPQWAWTIGGQATSTAGTGTTTVPAVTFPAGATITDAYCNVSGVGTWDVQFNYGPSDTKLAMIIASSTNYKVIFSSNNTPAAGATTTFAFGTAASSPVYTPNCTFEGTWNNSL